MLITYNTDTKTVSVVPSESVRMEPGRSPSAIHAYPAEEDGDRITVRKVAATLLPHGTVQVATCSTFLAETVCAMAAIAMHDIGRVDLDSLIQSLSAERSP